MGKLRLALLSTFSFLLSAFAFAQGVIPLRIDSTGTLQLPASAPLTTFKSANNVAYIGPSGDDANAGTRAAPLATSAAALLKIGNEGEIILLEGDYTGLKFNLASAKTVTIRGEPDKLIRVYLGETHSSGFTNVAGAVGVDPDNVYKKTISTVIPIASDRSNGGDIGVWVFEQGTTEGPITVPHPLQKGRTTRLDHTRLTVASSLANLKAGADGRYWYAANVLYIKATDHANLATSPKTYQIPSQTANQSFVYGATSATNIKVQGIQVYYGFDNFSVSGCSRYEIIRCLAFGAGREGIIADEIDYGEETQNELAANGNDGSSVGNVTSNRLSFLHTIDCWSHDNGDEGNSPHDHMFGTFTGGLFENNGSSGIGPFNANITCYYTHTRNNTFNGGIYPSGSDKVSCYGCISEGDAAGINVSAGGTGYAYGCTAINPTGAVGFVAGVASSITLQNCSVTGGGTTGGSGTITVLGTDRIGKMTINSGHAIRGTNASFQVDPFGSATTSLGAPQMLIGGENTLAANGIDSIGFGYTDGTGSIPPTQIGYINTPSGGFTKGSLFFATRDVTTNTAPTTRLTISPAGDATFTGSVTAGTGGFIGSANLSSAVVPLISGSTAANGDITINGTTSGTKTSSYVILQDAGGNVGIGTPTPSTTLQVAGTFLATDNAEIGGTLTVDGIASMAALSTVGGNHIAVFDSTNTFSAAQTFSAAVTLSSTLAMGGTAITFGALPSGATTAGALATYAAQTYTVTGTNTATAFQAVYHGVPTFTDSSAGTITDSFSEVWAGPAVRAGSLVTAGTRTHTLGILDSTSASSAITGALVVATTFGTAATSVGIGGGNINAGGAVTVGGNITGGGNISPGQTGLINWNNRSEISSPAGGRLLFTGLSAAAFTRLAFHTETTSDAALQISGTGITTGLGDGTAGGSFTASGTFTATGNVTQTAKTTTYNNEATAGEGLAPIRGFTSQKAVTNAGDTNVLTVTPAAAAGTYRIAVQISLASATSGVVGWTATWTDSNSNAQTPTNLSLFQSGTAGPALTFTTSAASNYYAEAIIDVNNAGTNIVVKLTGSGTYSGKMSASIERLN